jgi:hypothetical protein
MIKDIGGDLAAYNLLLDRSLLNFADDLTLNDETKAARIIGRRQTLEMNYVKG